MKRTGLGLSVFLFLSQALYCANTPPPAPSAELPPVVRRARRYVMENTPAPRPLSRASASPPPLTPALPTPPPVSSEPLPRIQVAYRCLAPQPFSTQIRFGVKLRNLSPFPVELSALRLDYYYTHPVESREILLIEYAVWGSSNTYGHLRKDHCELSFSAGAGQLAPGVWSGEVIVQLRQADWGEYRQYEDYSFRPRSTRYQRTERLCLYYHGQLSAGHEPAAQWLARPTPLPSCNPRAGVRLSGRISDARSGAGLPGVTVLMEVPDYQFFRGKQVMAWSDTEGFYTIGTALCAEPPTYTLRIRAAGYAEVVLQCSPGETLQQDLQLLPLVYAFHTPRPLPLPTPLPRGMRVCLEPAAKQAYLSVPFFTTRVTALELPRSLAAYSMEVFFDAGVLRIDRAQGNNGVSAGEDGFIAAVNPSPPGRLLISGFDIEGQEPSRQMELLELHWRALSEGTSPLELVVHSFIDEQYNELKVSPVGATVDVYRALLGDVNSDALIDWQDALLLAQTAAGLAPANFCSRNADLNGDLRIDIVDALLAAAYAAGRIDSFD